MFVGFRHWSVFVLVLGFAAAAHAQQADLAATKTGPALAAVGEDVSYTVTVTNNGAATAADVTLSDPIPEDMTFVSFSQDSGPAFVCLTPGVGTNGTITCTNAALLSGATAAFTFTFNISPVLPGTPFTNTATVSSATTPDPDQNNNSASATTTTPAGDLIVSKSGPATAAAGDDVTYVVVVTNFGPATAGSVTLTDAVPANTTFVSLTQDSGPAASCSGPPNLPAPQTITCSMDGLEPGESAQFTFVFNIDPGAPDGTEITNIATADSPDDPNSENNSAVAVTIIPFPPQGDLSVIKTGPSSAGPDTDVTFTITLTNSGPDDAVNVELNDTLPGTMTLVSLSTSGEAMSCTTPAVGAGGTITCTADPFAAGGTTTILVTGHIPAGTSSGTLFNNTVMVTADNDPFDENDSASTTVTISSVDVSVDKTGPGSVLAGNTITYDLTVANAGPDPAAITFFDPVPAGATFQSFQQNTGPSGPCTLPQVGGGGAVQCEFTLGPQVSATFTLVLNATGTTASVTNTASISTESFDVDTSDNESTVVTTVTPVADLSVVKNGPALINAGADITYTITASNAGPSAAANVSLTDALPANTTFVSAMQTGGPAFNCTTGGVITCTLPSFAAGASATFTFVFHVASSATGSVSNTAQIASTTTDSDSNDLDSTFVSTVTTSADLSVTKTGPATVDPGANVTFTIAVSNAGPSDASTVSLTDTLPPGTTFVSTNQTTGPVFNCVNPPAGSGGTITCTIATFPAAASATFDVVFAVGPAVQGTIDNTAQISAATSDPNGNNNSSQAVTNVNPLADVSVAKSGPALITAGADITYTITASNGGPAAAANVTLTDTLPVNTVFVSADQTSGPAFNCTKPAAGAGGTITCTLASLAVNASATFTFVFHVLPSATGSVSNTAQIASTTLDPDSIDHDSTVVSTITTSADLSVTKTGPAAVSAGSNVTFTIAVNNAGPSDASTVTLSDTLPAGTTFVSADQTGGPAFNCVKPAVGSGGTITCTVAAFPASGSATFDVVFAVAAGAQGSLDNTAQISAATLDPNGNNNSSTATVGISPGPTDLSITKTASGGQHGVGSPVTYTIVVTNNGPSIAFGTTVTDPLPPGTTYQSATPSQGSCTGTTTVVCNLGTLAVSASATITLNVFLPGTPGQVSNTATVSAANAETNANDNASTAAIAVSAEIPTLSAYALMLLALVLAVAAVRAAKMQ